MQSQPAYGVETTFFRRCNNIKKLKRRHCLSGQSDRLGWYIVKIKLLHTVFSVQFWWFGNYERNASWNTASFLTEGPWNTFITYLQTSSSSLTEIYVRNFERENVNNLFINVIYFVNLSNCNIQLIINCSNVLQSKGGNLL